PPEFVDMIWRCWGKGSHPAVLTIYRDADPDRLAEAGRDLGRLTCPSLVVWGDRDLYLPEKFGRGYAAALPASELEIVEGAGHWPWIDQPTVIDRVLEFLA